MTQITFVGTGNYLAPGRYWNSFVIDGHILVEPSPAVLPNLRRCGVPPADLDVVVISHFHADHTFGWPFLLLELIRHRGATPVFIVGPPGVEAHLATMMDVGGVSEVQAAARDQLDLRYVEVDGSSQTAGPLRYQAVEVDHVPYLRCFGYVFEIGASTLGYSGDTRPCAGLDVIARASDTLVLECNGPHPPPVTHMDVGDVAALRKRFPDLRLVLTHLGADVDARHVDNCIVPDDFETVEFD